PSTRSDWMGYLSGWAAGAAAFFVDFLGVCVKAGAGASSRARARKRSIIFILGDVRGVARLRGKSFTAEMQSRRKTFLFGRHRLFQFFNAGADFIDVAGVRGDFEIGSQMIECAGRVM